MHCRICLELKAAYEDSALAYRQAVVRTRRMSDDDYVVAISAGVALHDLAMDDYRKLITHLKAEHWGHHDEQPAQI